MPKISFSLLTLALCAALSACGGPAEPVTDDARIGMDEGDGAVGVYVDPKGDAREGRGKRIVPAEDVVNSSDDLMLGALDLEDFKRMIGPLKGCSFKIKGQQETLLVASANANGRTPPQAIVRMGGEAIILDAIKKGGLGYLAGGPEFRGQNIAIEVTPEEGPAERTNAKTQNWDAAIVVRGTGKTVRVYRGGEYSCDF